MRLLNSLQVITARINIMIHLTVKFCLHVLRPAGETQLSALKRSLKSFNKCSRVFFSDSLHEGGAALL